MEEKWEKEEGKKEIPGRCASLLVWVGQSESWQRATKLPMAHDGDGAGAGASLVHGRSE